MHMHATRCIHTYIHMHATRYIYTHTYACNKIHIHIHTYACNKMQTTNSTAPFRSYLSLLECKPLDYFVRHILLSFLSMPFFTQKCTGSNFEIQTPARALLALKGSGARRT